MNVLRSSEMQRAELSVTTRLYENLLRSKFSIRLLLGKAYKIPVHLRTCLTKFFTLTGVITPDMWNLELFV